MNFEELFLNIDIICALHWTDITSDRKEARGGGGGKDPHIVYIHMFHEPIIFKAFLSSLGPLSYL